MRPEPFPRLRCGHRQDTQTFPDRDLYVFDTRTDRPGADRRHGVGTLLYGITADSREQRVFVTQTDARNDANGKAGTRGHGLAETGESGVPEPHHARSIARRRMPEPPRIRTT